MHLTDNEITALSAWRGSNEENNVLSFAAVAQRSAIPQGSVRRFVRALARKGALQFCRMSWNDEGPCGAGYMPTKAGYEAIAEFGDTE
jgi:predicted transcriptional regulator